MNLRYTVLIILYPFYKTQFLWYIFFVPEKQRSYRLSKEATQFKPGVSGNPNGRPLKEHSLTDLLKEALEQPHNDTGKTKKQVVIETLYRIATEKEDVVMLKYLFDRIDGKPLQRIEAEVRRPEADLSNLTKKEKKNLADINRKRKSYGE